jgi:ketosteroid isomerase-like protein
MTWYSLGARKIMKTLAITLVACCLLLAIPTHAQDKPVPHAMFGAETGTVSRESVPASVTAQLTPLIGELQAAAGAHDTDRFMALYARRADLVAVFNGEEIRGWEDLHAQQLKWWKNGKSDVVYTPRGAPEILVLGPDAAVVTLLLDSTRTAADGTASKNSFAISMVWKKLPEGWRMVYSHESTVH